MFGRREPDEPTARFAWLMKRHRYDEALKLVDEFLAELPDVALSWRAKGECLFAMERFADAIPCFVRASEIGGPGTEEVLFWKAFCLQNLGQKEEARTELEAFIDSTSDPQAAAAATKAIEAFDKQ